MNLNRLLKEAIAQGSVRAVRKPVAALRHDVAALKRQVAALRRELRRVQKTDSSAVVRHGEEVEETSGARKMRPTGPMVRRLRNKLGLTQAEFAKLTGVSSLTVWKWEKAAGRIVLRQRTSARLQAVRGMGKREAKAALA